MLTVRMPDNCRNEREYVVSHALGGVLGIDFRTVYEPRDGVAIVGADGRELLLSDAFFQRASRHWLEEPSMPSLPLADFRLPANLGAERFCGASLPVLFGDDRRVTPDHAGDSTSPCCTIDLFGSIFFMLSRYEEIVTQERDEHGRFPSDAGIARRAGFADRPLADEYIELLWQLLHARWPSLTRKARSYRFFLSHDVDTPYWVYGRSAVALAGGLAADLLLSRDPKRAVRRVATVAATLFGGPGRDPFNTFRFVLDQSHRHGLRNAFYFIPRNRSGRLDGTHAWGSRVMRDLLREIAGEGHEIGLHPGYTTHDRPERVSESFALLRDECQRAGVRQDSWGGRQHYLRWQNPTTWAAWDAAGLDYDSTLGYSEGAGFRCGACHEFPAYDLAARRGLSLLERPLVAMECALTFAQDKPDRASLDTVERLAANCRRMNGDFTLLWHNNNLRTAPQRESYREAMEMAA